MNRNKGERLSGLEKSGKALWMRWNLIWVFKEGKNLYKEREKGNTVQREVITATTNSGRINQYNSINRGTKCSPLWSHSAV